MDFGFMSLESLVGPTEPTSSLAEEASEAKPKPKPKPKLGSGFLKKERSGPEKQQQDDDDDGNGEEEEEEGNNGDGDSSYRASKMAKTMASRSSSLFLGGEAIMARQKQEQVLISFSADHSKSEVCFLGKDGDGTVMERSGQTAQTQSLAFPYSQRMASSYNPRNTVSGYGSGSLNQTMHVGLRGPFTPSQWIELEHQALIYKYITANVPVPSNLLLPIKKSLNPFAFPPLLSSLPANSFGWGGFHLGFADNSDPEPGRCRRTDGKKWRCSRDAVADQKYCERHINRGRHRSRKPVEAGQQQTGQAASAATAAAAAATSKAMPLAASAMPGCGGGGVGGGGGGPSSGLAAFKGGPDPALANRMQDLRGALSVMSSCSAAVNLKPGESTFVVPKQEIVVPPEAATSQSVFGLVSTDSLLNPTSYITSKSYASSFLDFGGQGSQDHQNHPLRHFIDDWPKDESSRPVIAWPEEIKPEWTQLSMSIPMTSSDFSSSSNSPKQEKLALSPLRLSREFERPPPPMPTTNLNLSQKQQQHAANWVPISWGSSSCTMGGPLGEVLTNTSSSLGNPKQHCRNPSSSLNLLTEGWDGSPQLGSSPTGVLQKSTFCSLSNSSSGSSPRADNNNNNNGKKSNNADDRKSAYEEAIGSTLASSSVPSL